jgi:hypothetical protein
MGALQRCSVPGCTTWTPSGCCHAHGFESLAVAGLPSSAAVAINRMGGAGVRTPRLVPADARAGDPCQLGDPWFDAWLHDCRGFRVITPSGRVGIVACVIDISELGPPALLIRIGILRRKLIEIHPEDIDWIIPVGRRILLRGNPS